MKKYAIVGKNEVVPKAIKPRFFQRMLKSKNLRNLVVAGAIGLGVILPITIDVPKIFTNPKGVVAITNVFGEEPWGGYKIAPLQEQYKGKNGVMRWIKPVTDAPAVMTNFNNHGVMVTEDLKELGITKFSDNAKIVPAIVSNGCMYYVIIDSGMTGLLVVGVSNIPDSVDGSPSTIGTGVISSNLVKPLPPNYTFDMAEREGVFALVTTTALVIITNQNGDVRISTDPTEDYPLPIHPKVNITSFGEVVVTDPNWKKPAVVRIMDNGEVKTYDQPLAAVYPK